MWTLITGSTSPLGKAIALKLAQEGYALVLHYHNNKQQAQDLSKACLKYGVKVEIMEGDFSSSQSLQQFIDTFISQFSNLDILVNNVGHYLSSSMLETPIQTYRILFDKNFFTPIALSLAFKELLAQSKGHIINLGVSGINELRVFQSAPIYALTKHALLHATKSLAREMAPHHIKVNMLSPGQLDYSEDLAHFLDKLPMKKPITCEEITQALYFLVKNKRSSITGQNIEVAGGFSL